MITEAIFCKSFDENTKTSIVPWQYPDLPLVSIISNLKHYVTDTDDKRQTNTCDINIHVCAYVYAVELVKNMKYKEVFRLAKLLYNANEAEYREANLGHFDIR